MELKNDRLRVTFAQPGQVQTQRFDNTAIITEVILDEEYAFCTQEQVLPGRRTTNGVGLCGEFVLEGAAEEAKAGEWFCKPGVGLLRQTEDFASYDMWKTYEVNPFPGEEIHHGDSAVFRQKAAPWGGFGVEIEKVFRLEGNRLILEITARNGGSRSCRLREYQHNFFCLEGLPIGAGYGLQLPCDGELHSFERQTLRQGDEKIMPSAVTLRGDEVHWIRGMDGLVLYHCSETIDSAAPKVWTLRHEKVRASVSEECGFCPDRIDVWAVEHCICPEFYFSAELPPGETARWQRTWTFSA